MLFNSLHFLFFLPLVFILYWIIPFRWRWLLLLVASYYFYMSWNPAFGLLLLATTLIDYFTALKIYRTEDFKIKKYWLYVSLISNIGCLFTFKYFVFFFNSSVFFINKFSAAEYNTLENFIIPVGL